MARVPYLTAEDLPESERALLDRPINLNRALANSPAALEANRFVGRWARFRSAVDPRTRELAIVLIGALTGNLYEYAHHLHLAKDFGADDADLDDVQRFRRGEPTSLPQEVLVALSAARRLTEDGTLSDAQWSEVEGSMGTAAAVDFVMIVSYYSMVVRVLSALDIELEPDWMAELDAHPLR
jgi:alkylhydroperoxidase family enzyme